MTFKEILSTAQKSLATDIYITANKTIYIKSRDQTKAISSNQPQLNNNQILKLIERILSKDDFATYEEHKSFLTYYLAKGLSLYKVFMFEDDHKHNLHFQPISSDLPTSKSLNTTVADGYATFEKGLIIMLGEKQSGKTHTINAFLNTANAKNEKHLCFISKQNPWQHENNNSLVTQLSFKTNIDETLDKALQINPDMLFIDDLSFDEFIRLSDIYDYSKPTVLTLNSGSLYQFILKLKKNKLAEPLQNFISLIIHQRLIFSDIKATHIPVFESAEHSKELSKLLTSNSDELKMTSSLSDLNSKQCGQGIAPIENYLLRLVNNKLMGSQQALKFCKNRSDLMKKLTANEPAVNIVSKPTIPSETLPINLDSGWTNIENIRIEDD